VKVHDSKTLSGGGSKQLHEVEGGKSQVKGKKIRCYTCGEYGHTSQECRQLKTESTGRSKGNAESSVFK